MSLLGVLSAVGDIATVGSNVAGTIDQIKTNDLNYKLAKENLDYQKNLQQVIFGREDSAIRRRVEDLKKAGLSPTLAAGSGASSGSVVSTSAPKRESSMEALANLATIKTLIAQQQKAQTEADIAKNELVQDKMNTDYYKSVGVAPVQANMSWKNMLTNVLAGFFNPNSVINSAISDFLTKSSSFVSALADKVVGETNGAAYNPDGSVTSKTGQSISSAQVGLLKGKGLYQEFIRNGLTINVLNALGMDKKRGSGGGSW